MTKTILNVKTDNDVKKQAQETAQELGVPLSTVVNAFLKQFIRDKEVTFSAVPQMTPQLEKLLVGIEEDIRLGKNVDGPFSTSEELQAHLDSLK